LVLGRLACPVGVDSLKLRATCFVARRVELRFGLALAMAACSNTNIASDVADDDARDQDELNTAEVTTPPDSIDSRFDTRGELAELCFTYDPGATGVPAQTYGTPSAADGLLYQPVVAFPTPNRQVNQLRAVDADGREVWSTDLSFVGSFIGAPAIDSDGNALVLMVSQTDFRGMLASLTKVHRNGGVVWEQGVAGSTNGELPTRQFRLAVDAAGGTYVVTAESVLAFDLHGVERWRIPLPAARESEPACRKDRARWDLLVLDGDLFLTEPDCGTLRIALDGATWSQFSMGFQEMIPTPEGHLFGKYLGRMVSLDPDTGATVEFPEVYRLPAVFDTQSNLYAHRQEAPVSSWSGLELRWTSTASANLEGPMTMLADEDGSLLLYNQYGLGWSVLERDSGVVVFDRSIGRGVQWQFQPAVMLRAGEVVTVTSRDGDAGGYILTCVRVPIGLPLGGVWSSTGGNFRNDRRYTSRR